MPSKIKTIFFSMICLVLLLQYTNCANFSEVESNLHFSSGLCFDTDSCSEALSSGLKLIPTLNPFINHNQTSFNVSGYCSASHYPTHLITYTTYLSETRVRSNSVEQEGACINGKFIIHVNAPDLEAGNSIIVSLNIVAIDSDGVRVKGYLTDRDITLSKERSPE